MTDDEVEGDLSHLRKACQKADLVVASWDDGKLLLKGAALLDDGQDTLWWELMKMRGLTKLMGFSLV